MLACTCPDRIAMSCHLSSASKSAVFILATMVVKPPATGDVTHICGMLGLMASTRPKFYGGLCMLCLVRFALPTSSAQA